MPGLVDELNQRWQSLRNERSSWISHWEEISRYLSPRAGRYFLSDRNKGWKRHQAIYDSTATRALRVLADGIMSGMTSTSRPWFKLTLSAPELNNQAEVKLWLTQVTGQIETVLAQSNAYRVLHGLYEELGAFGSAAALVNDDYQNVIHLHAFTIGEYAIAADWKGNVNCLYREFEKTAAAIVAEFGLDHCSPAVQAAYRNGNLEQWFALRHCVEPRQDRDPAKLDANNMAWRSCYWESAGNGRLLRESGYRHFPILAPRWATQGGDVYGNSPGMEALGDIKQLQAQQFRKSQAIDYQANPPLQIPSSMKNRELEIFPGGVSYYDATGGGIKSAFEVNLNLETLLLDIQDVRGRINAAFYSDLFMMLSEQEQRMTATEVAERHEEKMLMLGPVVERLNNELLDPLIENVFGRLVAANLLPPPPAALHGQPLQVEYVSLLAQAQKAISVNSIDRFVSSLGQIAAAKPDVLDKFDADEWANVYSDQLGIDPALIVSGRRLNWIRRQREQQQLALQQRESLLQGSQAVKNLGQTSTDGTAAAAAMQALGLPRPS